MLDHTGIAEARSALPVCDGAFRMRYAKAEGDTLVICFASVGRRPNITPPDEFVGAVMSQSDCHALFVSDARRTWLNDAHLRSALVRVVEELKESCGIRRVITLGLSMGGFSALAAAQLFDVTASLALSPQFSVDPDVMPEEERWKEWRDQIDAHHFRDCVPPVDTGNHFVLHGLANDYPHMRRFPERDNIHHYVFPTESHMTVVRRLKQAGFLPALISAVICDDRPGFEDMVKATGGMPR